MHVDGFRFDLASILTRGSRLCAMPFVSISSLSFCQRSSFIWFFSFWLFPSLWDAVNVYGNPMGGDLLTTGTPLSNPPLIDMISNDPVLRGVKVITVGSFFILIREVRPLVTCLPISVSGGK